MRANTPGAARDVDPEYVHDLRVATRRGRFALKLFSGILEPAFCASMRIELAWMAGLLGELRDLDVFAGRIERQFLRIESATGFRDGMAAWVASRRAEALQELQEAMRSPRYSRLLASLEETGEGGKDCEDDSGTGLSAFARSRISKAVRKLSSRAAIAAGAAGAAELHPVRILFKRLRYTCEFFRPYLGGRLSRLVELLVSFQDCLGAHQDACSAMGLLAAWQVEMPGVLSNSSHALSLGALLQLQRDERDSQSARFRELWASSADVLARWRSQRAAGAEE
jgi:CHAD domain-containing protein